MGAYRHGANRMVDAALEHESAINDFLRQQPTEMNPLDETLETMTRWLRTWDRPIRTKDG
ncbi:MAG: hypothetical protein Ct9H300mP1_05370 [Planctomycetaceae bacterium]|nr:MAG: hypothetical protein Ct9H300mP1_05370 [Planctomycetaceae bacterium]